MYFVVICERAEIVEVLEICFSAHSDTSTYEVSLLSFNVRSYILHTLGIVSKIWSQGLKNMLWTKRFSYVKALGVCVFEKLFASSFFRFWMGFWFVYERLIRILSFAFCVLFDIFYLKRLALYI